jgi:hypothetical protein
MLFLIFEIKKLNNKKLNNKKLNNKKLKPAFACKPKTFGCASNGNFSRYSIYFSCFPHGIE